MNESMPGITETQIENWFTYHKPEGGDPERYAAIRDKAKELARVIVMNAPHCADTTAAIRSLLSAVWQANAAIACRGR